MTRDDLIVLIMAHVPGLKPGDVAVAERTGRLLIVVRRPDADLAPLQAAMLDNLPAISCEVRGVTATWPPRLAPEEEQR